MKQSASGKYQLQTEKTQQSLDKAQNDFDRLQEKFERSQQDSRRVRIFLFHRIQFLILFFIKNNTTILTYVSQS